MRCPHDLDREFCAECRTPGRVYVTGSGSHFHDSLSCSRIEAGAMTASAELAFPVRSVPVAEAIAWSYEACETCSPVAGSITVSVRTKRG